MCIELAAFQIPYGLWSDRAGRKPVILIGLMQLILGMLLAGFTKNIYVFIIARALQGSGAVMAIAYSWLGDRIDNNSKGRAMSIAETVVAIGAITAFAIGPLLYQWFSLSYMFYACAMLIFGAWILILTSIKEEQTLKLCGRQGTAYHLNHGYRQQQLASFGVNVDENIRQQSKFKGKGQQTCSRSY